MILFERCVEEYGSNWEASDSGTSLGGTSALSPLFFDGIFNEARESDMAEVVVVVSVALLVILIADRKLGAVLLRASLLAGLL